MADREPTDDEILKSMRPETRAMFDKATDPKEKARMWQGAKKRLLAKRLSESPPRESRQDNPDTWLYLDRSSGTPTLRKHNPNEENQRREADARAMRRAFVDALREVERDKETQRGLDNFTRQAGFVPISEFPIPASARHPSKFSSAIWAEIKKHRGWYVVFFLLGGLPVGLATVWTPITRQTVPEWLAERGLPRLTHLVIGWVAIAAIIALVIVFRSYLSVRARNK